MMNSAVAKRYGQALLQIAQDNNSVGDYQNELQLVVDTINANDELKTVWLGKEFDNETKIKVIKEIFTNKVSTYVVNLLCIVINKAREEFLSDILAMYKVYADEANNIAYAEVTSAIALSDEQQQALVGKLAQCTGKTIKLSTKIDKDIVGGLCVKYGDKVYDGTVKARLTALQNNLLEA